MLTSEGSTLEIVAASSRIVVIVKSVARLDERQVSEMKTSCWRL